ncbi:MAG: 4-(cytidine 5'-diphospho)-2-C-methyl-D-erythritol kinase [Bryobacterales bacterium]|nr:4-(cytidine 5'-diphospho)-2-C-methyl-D-erythritol kinase [Bryobacterales bacterium]
MEIVPTVRVPSLAKLNLTLDVIGKRPDGFHELRSLFQTISLADEIEIDWRPARRTSLTIDCTPAIPDNIILRAAEAVLAALKRKASLRFTVRKRIPMGAGLGGGSSNAAAVLLALPPLLGKPLPLPRLLEIAAQLGSDVPFFLLGGTALVMGRGEELYPFPEPKVSDGVLIAPGIHVSTPDAYRALGRPPLTRIDASRIINSFQLLSWDFGEGLPVSSWRGACRNDFEAVVFRQHPQIREWKKKLLATGAPVALMTGSGSAVFAFFANRIDARHAAKSFPATATHLFRTVNRAQYRALWRKALGLDARATSWPPLSWYAE